MSWDVSLSRVAPLLEAYTQNINVIQIHYNANLDDECGADLHTYLVDPSVFDVKDGHIAALEGASRDRNEGFYFH